MYRVYVDLKNRQTILPFESKMGAIYFVSSCREHAELHLEYLPAMDVINGDTGEVVYQSPEITPCDYYHWDDFAKARENGNLCEGCLRKTCNLKNASFDW